jgi:predicted esterase
MKKTLYPILAVFSLLSTVHANSDMRKWEFKDGTSITAELIEYQEDSGSVSLRKEDKTILKIVKNELRPLDEAWILQWVEFTEESQALIRKLGGKLERHASSGRYPTEYSVYHPSGDQPVGELPLLILFHPGGQGHRDILRYVEAADAVKMTLVSCETFQNTGDNAVKEAEMLERFMELLPQIEATVPHDANKVFMGGVSGGGWRAFHYSAQIQRPWAGIFANCSWVGDKKWWDLPYPAMRVALVSGNNDYGRWTLERDTKLLQARGSVVSVQAFEGGHQVAPPDVMTKSFRWLLGEIE